MNKHIINILLGGAVTLGVASCSENSWNDRYLDGFDGGVDYENAQTATYTLTSDDYETISSLLQSVATTTEETTAAKAIGTNYYFDKTSVYPASVAIPYFLASSSSPYYYYSNGSSLEINFAEASEVPEELSQLAASSTYTVSTSDYQGVWGSETAFISSFSPEKPASSNLASILKTAFPDAEAGDYAIVTYNTATENPMFGYPDAATPTANLYTDGMAAGTYFMTDVDGCVVAGNLAETSTYGYLPSYDVTVSGETITGVDSDTQQFEFEAADGEDEYYIKDMLGRYYYQSGTYNSFNVSTSNAKTDNYTWTVTAEEDNSWQIMNKAVSKWIQTPFGSYSTWGSYNYAGGGNNNFPKLFVLDESSNAEPQETALYTPVSTVQNAVYYFNGSSWSAADGVTVLNPADYTAMGFSNNSLSDADIYLPKYMGSVNPYAQEGDQEFVVYNVKSNSASVDLLVYNGSAWEVNNNGLENTAALFTKSNGSWSFVKYLGKAIYDLFTADEIELDRSYVIVYGNIAATPVPTSSSYGYLQATSVSISGTQIIMANENNAFTFATTYEYNGSTGTVPTGTFLLLDSNGRYLYLQGTYSSFNVRSSAPYIESDGSVGTGYLFTATKQSDGTWAIVSEFNSRILFYSSSYNNFAAYASAGSTDYMPVLYQLEAE